MQRRVITNDKGEKVYVTIDGDMIDEIAHAYYGKHAQHTELLLEANPHVVRMPTNLPAGVVIKLPEVRKEDPKPFLQLWD